MAASATAPRHAAGDRPAVTAIDAAPEAIAVARAHAEAQGLAIDYRAAGAEVLAAAGERFDLVTSMEVIEHVADIDFWVGNHRDDEFLYELRL